MNVSIVGENTIKDQNKGQNETIEPISWSVFHAERQTQVSPMCTRSLLSLCSDCAHSMAMIRHAITVTLLAKP